jgi:hypothetical protein
MSTLFKRALIGGKSINVFSPFMMTDITCTVSLMVNIKITIYRDPRDLYIESSSHSLDTMDDHIFASKYSTDKEHLVQSIVRTCEPHKPLIVSISRQWSSDYDNEYEPMNILPPRLLKSTFREHRSQSDTTAMELALIRQQYNDNTNYRPNYSSPKKILPRGLRLSSSVSSTADQLESLPENHEASPQLNGYNGNTGKDLKLSSVKLNIKSIFLRPIWAHFLNYLNNKY